jgi:hypothetical protein
MFNFNTLDFMELIGDGGDHYFKSPFSRAESSQIQGEYCSLTLSPDVSKSQLSNKTLHIPISTFTNPHPPLI